MEATGLQRMIGAALVDRKIERTLLLNPLTLADRFELSISERRFISRVRPRDLEHFAILVEQWRDEQSLSSRWGVITPERVQRVS